MFDKPNDINNQEVSNFGEVVGGEEKTSKINQEISNLSEIIGGGRKTSTMSTTLSNFATGKSASTKSMLTKIICGMLGTMSPKKNIARQTAR